MHLISDFMCGNQNQQVPPSILMNWWNDSYLGYSVFFNAEFWVNVIKVNLFYVLTIRLAFVYELIDFDT